MRIDIVTIFPQFFTVLDLSLMGKAQGKDAAAGGVEFGIHDLRDWTADRHRTVDDAPYGGGAGMVMRADVWGKALDEVLGLGAPEAGGMVDAAVVGPRTEGPETTVTQAYETAGTGSFEAATAGAVDGVGADNALTTPQRRVLAVPTPSGEPLTQARVEDLATADQIAIACGRYEGIDYRVVEEYRDHPQVEVVEFSIGDYVLNGGEVAALALIEAVARLREGFMSNPESLVEESFTDQLLEYPAFTRPANWRGREVPAELLSGDHGRIAQWRRSQSLQRTATRRPDLVAALDVARLSIADREQLAQLGWIHADKWQRLQIRAAQAEDVAALVELARRTFPDACPDHLTEQAIANHIATQLNAEAIGGWIEDSQKRVLVAQIGGQVVGYTMVENYRAGEFPADVPRKYLQAAPTYLSKCYVDAHLRGTGLAGALVEEAVLEAAQRQESSQMVVGTNRGNERAIKFYRRHGFKRRGRRIFYVDGIRNEDVVLVRTLR